MEQQAPVSVEGAAAAASESAASTASQPLPRILDDSILVSFNATPDAMDMKEIYFCARDRLSMMASVKAVKKFDERTFYKHWFVTAALPLSDREVAHASPWCTGEFMYAALHTYCSDLADTAARRTVRFLSSIHVPVALDRFADRHPDSRRDLANLMRVCAATETGECDEGDLTDPMTVFHRLSGFNAIVLPLNTTETHWSLLVFYRTQPRSAKWSVFHYDSLLGFHADYAHETTTRFAVLLAIVEPDAELVRDESRRAADEEFAATYVSKRRRITSPNVVSHFSATPQQTGNWECGYKTLKMALAVAYCEGHIDRANRMIASNVQTNDEACAKYIATCIAKISSYMYLLNARTRCRNLFQKYGVRETKRDGGSQSSTSSDDVKIVDQRAPEATPQENGVHETWMNLSVDEIISTRGDSDASSS